MPTLLQDVTVHRGQILLGDLVIDYETRQPAYSQWIAIGMVRIGDTSRLVSETCRYLVGTGRAEQEAITDLRNRVLRPVQTSDDDFAVAWVTHACPSAANA